MVSERGRDRLARRAAERVALVVAPPVGCSPGGALAAIGGVVLAYVAFLAFIFVWSGICHAVSLVWPGLSPAHRTVIRRMAWVAVFWLAGRHWDQLVASFGLDGTVSVLGLMAVFLLGVRQIVVLAQASIVVVVIPENGQGTFGPVLVPFGREHPLMTSHPRFTKLLGVFLTRLWHAPAPVFQHP